jgi:hypothetical protein
MPFLSNHRGFFFGGGLAHLWVRVVGRDPDTPPLNGRALAVTLFVLPTPALAAFSALGCC